jgi:hypothetical protein
MVIHERFLSMNLLQPLIFVTFKDLIIPRTLQQDYFSEIWVALFKRQEKSVLVANFQLLRFLNVEKIAVVALGIGILTCLPATHSLRSTSSVTGVVWRHNSHSALQILT